MSDNPDPLDHPREWKKEFETAGWWHSFELPDGTLVEGKCNLSGLKERLGKFPIPADLTGQRVLDVGTWDGWFAFELAKRGAHVVALDNWDNPRFREMRQILGLEQHVEYRLLDVYDLAPEALGRFDIVMFLGVLYHLKHPLLALEKVCAVTDGLACIDSFVLREQHRPDADVEHRLVMEFFETDEFGGQTDNWLAPSIPCLAAFCRTAGFARADLAAKLPYSASFACYRKWIAPREEWGPVPQLKDALHHLDFGMNFSVRRDDYIVAWFELDTTGLTLDDVFPEVGAYGVRPIHISRENTKERRWRTTFKLPPGLEPGWHDVKLRVRGSPLSNGVQIAVDLPLLGKTFQIESARDGATWQPDEVDLSRGTTIALWIVGLPEATDRGNLRVTVDGRLAEVSYLEAPNATNKRQLNVAIPLDCSLEPVIEVAVGVVRSTRRVRLVGVGR